METIEKLTPAYGTYTADTYGNGRLEARAVWGARMIAPCDLVANRQDLVSEDEAAKAALMEWLNPEGTGAIGKAQEKLREVYGRALKRDSEASMVLYEDDIGIIVGSAQASYGYVYVTGWLKAAAPAPAVAAELVTYKGSEGFFAAPIEAVTERERFHGTITAAALASRVTPFCETVEEAEAAAEDVVATVERAIETLRAGGRLRTTVGFETEDPILELSVFEGEVISTAVGGWAEGVVEPVCALGSEFLRGFLMRKVKIETLEGVT